MFMKKVVGKSGLSPVIATVLMILLVLVLAAMIFLWARGFIGEQIEKFGKPIEASCSELNFEVEKVEGTSGLDALEVVNRGDIDIFYLDVKKVSGGNSEMEKFGFPIDAGSSSKGDIDLTMSGGVVPEKIIVYPALVGSTGSESSNQVFTCIEVGKTITI
jgi:flagellin-like protein